MARKLYSGTQVVVLRGGARKGILRGMDYSAYKNIRNVVARDQKFEEESWLEGAKESIEKQLETVQSFDRRLKLQRRLAEINDKLAGMTLVGQAAAAVSGVVEKAVSAAKNLIGGKDVVA